MIGRCTWCAALPRAGRKPPPPEGFCSEICAAYYRAACADLGQELHRAGAVSIDNLRARLSRIARAGPVLRGSTPSAALMDQNTGVALALAAAIIAAGLRIAGLI